MSSSFQTELNVSFEFTIIFEASHSEINVIDIDENIDEESNTTTAEIEDIVLNELKKAFEDAHAKTTLQEYKE
jgi:hypothetical protein